MVSLEERLPSALEEYEPGYYLFLILLEPRQKMRDNNSIEEGSNPHFPSLGKEIPLGSSLSPAYANKKRTPGSPSDNYPDTWGFCLRKE